MPRFGQRDLEKERFWRGVIAKQRRSQLGKTEFCRQEDINLKSLQNWERIIRQRDREKANERRREQRRRRQSKQSQNNLSSLSTPDFVGVTSAEVSASCQGESIEISAPSGLIVRFPTHVDAQLVLAVLQTLCP